MNGTLWQLVGQQNARLIGRNMQSGEVVRSLPLGVNACTCKVAFGFGSVWLLRMGVIGAGSLRPIVTRFDQLSGRALKKIALSGNVDNGTLAAGNGSVWVLETDGTLLWTTRSRTASRASTKRAQSRRILSFRSPGMSGSASAS